MANSDDNVLPQGSSPKRFAAADSDGNFTLVSSPSAGKATKIVHISNLGEYLSSVKGHKAKVVIDAACKLKPNVPRPYEYEIEAKRNVHANSQPHVSPTKVKNFDSESVWDLKENIAEVLMHLKRLKLPSESDDDESGGASGGGDDDDGCNRSHGGNTQAHNDNHSRALGGEPIPLKQSRGVPLNPLVPVNSKQRMTCQESPLSSSSSSARARNVQVLRRNTATTTVPINATCKPKSATEHVQTSSRKSTPRQERKLGPRRKALLVGCCYLGDSEAALRGSCNDAFVMATLLVSHYGFDPRDVVLLIDSEPAQVYKDQLASLAQLQRWSRCTEATSSSSSRPKSSGFFKDMFSVFGNSTSDNANTEANLFELPKTLALDSPAQAAGGEACMPTRANILRGLRWLTQNTRPGDCCVFYYSGHGIQLDDLSGWEGEGYDEGLVPCDYMDHGGDPSRAIIPALQVKRMIQSVDKCCQVTLIVDAVGLQTLLDPAGCLGPWRFIRGSVTRGIWPIADATGKLKRANYNQAVYKSHKMQSQLVRPKYLSCIQVDCVANLLDGIFASAPATASVNAACIAAAPWQDVAIEALFKPLPLGGLAYIRREVFDSDGCSVASNSACESVVVHGCFTYCLALTILCDVSARGGPFLTLKELESGIVRRCEALKKSRLTLLQQTAQVTVHPSHLAGIDDYFAHIWGGKVSVALPSVGNPFKSLSAGPSCFLKLSDAWMQVHQEGRLIAQENSGHFGRMRSAALGNVNRLYTIDLNGSGHGRGPGSVVGGGVAAAARRGTSVPRQPTCPNVGVGSGNAVFGFGGACVSRAATGSFGNFNGSGGALTGFPGGATKGGNFNGSGGAFNLYAHGYTSAATSGTRLKPDANFTFQNFAPPLLHGNLPFQHVGMPSGFNSHHQQPFSYQQQAAPPPCQGFKGMLPQAQYIPFNMSESVQYPPASASASASASSIGPFVEYVQVPRRQATACPRINDYNAIHFANLQQQQQELQQLYGGADSVKYSNLKQMPMINTGKCNQGVHLVEPITAALLSQLPARRY